MTLPIQNLGVTGVVQQPGLGNVLGQSIGGISQMLQQLEQFRMQQARDNANQAYLGEQTTTMRQNREQAKLDREAAARQAQQQGEAYNQLLQLPQITGMFNPGEIASLRVMGPTAGMQWLQEQMKPQTVAGDSRMVTRGPGGVPTVSLPVDTTPKASDAPGTLREFLATRNLPLTMQPEDPAFPGQDYDTWLQQQTARGAGGTSVTVATDTFASGVGKAAGERIATQVDEAAAASRDLEVLSELKGLISQGMITGAGANAFTAVGNVLAQAGIGGDAVADPVARTQVYSALVGERVGRIITMFGSGTGLSNADREYAQKIAAGDITLTEPALTKLLDIAERANRVIIQRSNDAVNRMPVGEDVKAALRVDLPESAKPQSIQGRVGNQTYTYTLDPATGQYYRMQGGRRIIFTPSSP